MAGSCPRVRRGIVTSHPGGLPLAEPAAQSAPAIQRAAELSPCGAYRWTLSRWWGEGARVCWVMLNPSRANAEIDDPTIRRCIHFSRLWGFPGLVVVNLYPFRSSNPAECRRWAAQLEEDESVRQNTIKNERLVIATAGESALVMAAWGAAAWAQDAGITAVSDIIYRHFERLPSVYCLGTTADGAPKHPLARGRHRVPDDQRPVLWRSA